MTLPSLAVRSLDENTDAIEEAVEVGGAANAIVHTDA